MNCKISALKNVAHPMAIAMGLLMTEWAIRSEFIVLRFCHSISQQAE
jgi:hypothetical protein